MNAAKDPASAIITRAWLARLLVHVDLFELGLEFRRDRIDFLFRFFIDQSLPTTTDVFPKIAKTRTLVAVRLHQIVL